MSGSGVMITDVIFSTWKPVPNHPSGGFFGPRSTGENFRGLLEAHPVYIDPMSSLAGTYMVNFLSYRTVPWNPDIDCSGLLAEHARYQTIPAIGGVQHMCQDMQMGLGLGFCGLLENWSRPSDRRMSPSWALRPVVSSCRFSTHCSSVAPSTVSPDTPAPSRAFCALATLPRP